MPPHTIKTSARDDEFDARARRISGRILDGIEETLAELAQPRARRATIAIEAEREARARCAALLCRQAICRRARRCRRQPCAVPAMDIRPSS